jgi:chromosome partitioning protein
MGMDEQTAQRAKAHVIVIGNEKGGSGKSTVAMHLIVSLLRGGLKVGTIDLDARQATLTRYVENRRNYMETSGSSLPLPTHFPLLPTGNQALDEEKLREIVDYLNGFCDTIVIDTPGADTYLSRAGHSYADTLITPLNDSFVDLDVLARVDPETMRVLGGSHYTQMVFDVRKRRQFRDGGSIAWVVLRNRLSHLSARNKQDMERLIGDLARRQGFVHIQGLGERVIYRELFFSGLTLLDLNKDGVKSDMSMSHVAARQELRALLDAIGKAHAGHRAA